jgi:hypothetical protein
MLACTHTYTVLQERRIDSFDETAQDGKDKSDKGRKI